MPDVFANTPEGRLWSPPTVISTVAGASSRIMSTWIGAIGQIGENQIVLVRETEFLPFWVASKGDEVWVGRQGSAWRLTQPRAADLQSRRGSGERESASSLTAPMPGRVSVSTSTRESW